MAVSCAGYPGNSPDFRVTGRKPDLVLKMVLLVLFCQPLDRVQVALKSKK